MKDKVLVGDSGGELGVRGRLTALDLKTGKIAWRAYNTGSDADCRIGANFKPFYPKDQGKDQGIRVGRRDNGRWAAGRFGAGFPTILTSISSTTVPEMPACGTRTCGPADNKWSFTIWARNPETGDGEVGVPG